MRTILDLYLKNRTVILRCDLNVSIKDGNIRRSFEFKI